MTDETKKTTSHHLSMATRLLDVHKGWSPSGRFFARGFRVEVIDESNDPPVLLAECEKPEYAVMLCAYANKAPRLAKEVVRLNGVIDSLPGGDSKRPDCMATGLVELHNSELRARIKNLEAQLADSLSGEDSKRLAELKLIESRACEFIGLLDVMGERAREHDTRHDHMYYESQAQMLRDSLTKITL